MPSFFFYTAFIGMFFSVFTTAVLVHRGRKIENMRTLSEIAASSARKLLFFRVGIITSASLFTLTVTWFIVPQVRLGVLQEIAYLANFTSVVLLTLVPAGKGRAHKVHVFFAYSMAVSMIASGILFALNSAGGFRAVELGLTTLLVLAGVCTFMDRKRFVWYELIFIHVSHTTVLVSAASLV